MFGPIARNPATHALADALNRHIRTDASTAKRTEHSLGDTEELRAQVSGASFRDVGISTATTMVRFPSVNDYVRIRFAAAPLATLIAHYGAARRDSLIAALAQDIGMALALYAGNEGLTFP